MAKTLDDVVDLPANDRFSTVEKRLSGAGQTLPTISPAEAKDPGKERRNSSLSMPHYVWDLLRDEAYRSREPQNIVILRGLKAIGLAIEPEDLIDPRKLRYQS